MASLTKIFQGMMEAAVQGAAINARTNPLLVPTFFMLNPTGQIKIVAWEADERFYEAADVIRERITKPYQAVGLVYIAETDLLIESGKGPEGMMDGVIVYGYLSGYRGTTPRAQGRTFLLTTERELYPRSMVIPPKLTDWVKQVLSD